MRNQISLFTFLLSGLLLVAGCEEETAEPVDFSADFAYYPLELDRSLIYEQDSIVLFGEIGGARYDTSRSQVRETLVEEFVDGDGVTRYRGERYQRPNEGSPWTFVQSFTVERSATAARRTDDNLTFTKLTFPVRAGKSWDGHADFDETQQLPVGGEILDIYNNWRYSYAAAPLDTTINGNVLTDTWRVSQASVDNLIDLRQAYERYAPDIGLVERFLDARHTQCQDCCNGDTQPCRDLPWDEKAEKGFILHQTLLRVE